MFPSSAGWLSLVSGLIRSSDTGKAPLRAESRAGDTEAPSEEREMRQ